MSTAPAAIESPEDPPERCWLFLSQEIPVPLSGKHRCVGSAQVVAHRVEFARHNGELVRVHLLASGDDTLVAWINAGHIVAVMP